MSQSMLINAAQETLTLSRSVDRWLVLMRPSVCLCLLCVSISLPSPSFPMSTPSAAPSEKQAAVLEYLKQYKVNEELNVAVNRLCQQQTDDPFAFLVSCNTHDQTEERSRAEQRQRAASRA